MADRTPHGLHYRDQPPVKKNGIMAALADQWGYRHGVALRQAELYGAARDAALTGDLEHYSTVADEAEKCRP